jgi:putative IMPACT (imprinted ancient) family translation regulator
VIVVVVRYFGGTKLGVSGLITAYKEAAAEALKSATIVEKFILKRWQIEFSYADTSLVMSLVKEFDLEILAQDFGERCVLMVDAKIKKEGPLLKRIETLKAQRYDIQTKPAPVS